MKAYFVEGLFSSKKPGKGRKGGVEPFARVIWAASAEEALRLATEEIQGGQWVEPPKVSQTSEEKRMRALHAPELPGLGQPGKKKRT